jgi:hypothetical protein
MLFLVAALVCTAAASLPAPQAPNCVSAFATTRYLPANHVSGSMFTLFGNNARVDTVGNRAVNDGTLETSIWTATGFVSLIDYLNGTYTCETLGPQPVLAQPNYTFQGTATFRGSKVNTWFCSANCTFVSVRQPVLNSTSTMLSLVSNNDVIVYRDHSINGVLRETNTFTQQSVCKTADPSLFRVPSGLTCSSSKSGAKRFSYILNY